MRHPKFIYFDLGNVLLNFDHKLAFGQLARLSGIPAKQVRQILLGDGLHHQFESGQITSRQYYERFCEVSGTRPDYDALAHAVSAIFEVNLPMMPILTQLVVARYRMGLLSNTNEMHWSYCSDGRYGFLPDLFSVLALSYKIGVSKPDAKIYHAAADMAGVAPQEIFFLDDRAEHVEGARQVGFDAVQYTSVPELVAELHARGVRFNY